MRRIVGLHQRERLHQLVEGAEAAGHHHVGEANFTNITLRTKK